jgi:RNA polymerase sigma-54 factor
MAMKPGLRVQQTQRLTLTPALRQSISILGLSTTALDELVAREVEKNPLLVLEDGWQKSASDGFQYAVDTVADRPSLIEQLHRQIAVNSSPGKAQKLALYLAGNLTDQGFLSDTPEIIASTFGLEETIVQTAIGILQSCEPTGIGANDLQHCLMLQLTAQGESAENQRVILDNLDGFANQNWRALAKLTELTEIRLQGLGKTLRRLNPYPAEVLEPISFDRQPPDILVSVNPQGGFDVELAGSIAPILHVDQQLHETTISSHPAAKNYIQVQLESANSLCRAIEARSKTILRVSKHIVATQHEFFGGSQAKLVPQTRADLAQSLALHPSTISRAIAGKALECPFGVFPLKLFFTYSVDSITGKDSHSSYSVQQIIRKLIISESDDEILTDERITALLRHSGIDIRRRTVAKYRQCLNIPTSAQRRRSKKVL